MLSRTLLLGEIWDFRLIKLKQFIRIEVSREQTLTVINGGEKYINGPFFAGFSPDFPNIFNDETIALYQLSLSGFDMRLYGFIIVKCGRRA